MDDHERARHEHHKRQQAPILAKELGIDEEQAGQLIDEHGTHAAAREHYVREHVRSEFRAQGLASQLSLVHRHGVQTFLLSQSAAEVHRQIVRANATSQTHVLVDQIAGGPTMLQIASIMSVVDIDLDNDEHVDALTEQLRS
jgi:hypothetical protein